MTHAVIRYMGASALNRVQKMDSEIFKKNDDPNPILDVYSIKNRKLLSQAL